MIKIYSVSKWVLSYYFMYPEEMSSRRKIAPRLRKSGRLGRARDVMRKNGKIEITEKCDVMENFWDRIRNQQGRIHKGHTIL